MTDRDIAPRNEYTNKFVKKQQQLHAPNNITIDYEWSDIKYCNRSFFTGFTWAAFPYGPSFPFMWIALPFSNN